LEIFEQFLWRMWADDGFRVQEPSSGKKHL
jgi:hypothetical protein